MLARASAWIVAGLGFATVILSAYLAIRVYSPVWFADDWQVPLDYIVHGGRYSTDVTPLGMQPLMNTPLGKNFREIPASACLGDTAPLSVLGIKDGRKEIYARGWAFHKGAVSLLRAIATTEDGLIEGVGILGFERLDVLKVFP